MKYLIMAAVLINASFCYDLKTLTSNDYLILYGIILSVSILLFMKYLRSRAMIDQKKQNLNESKSYLPIE
jgi:hypothetical protein